MGLQFIWIVDFFVIHNFSNNTNLSRISKFYYVAVLYPAHLVFFKLHHGHVPCCLYDHTTHSVPQTTYCAMLHSPFASPCCLCYVLLLRGITSLTHYVVMPFLCHHSFFCCYSLALPTGLATAVGMPLLHPPSGVSAASIYRHTSQTNEDERRLQQHGATMEKVCSLKQPQLLSP